MGWFYVWIVCIYHICCIFALSQLEFFAQIEFSHTMKIETSCMTVDFMHFCATKDQLLICEDFLTFFPPRVAARVSFHTKQHVADIILKNVHNISHKLYFPISIISFLFSNQKSGSLLTSTFEPFDPLNYTPPPSKMTRKY